MQVTKRSRDHKMQAVQHRFHITHKSLLQSQCNQSFTHLNHLGNLQTLQKPLKQAHEIIQHHSSYLLQKQSKNSTPQTEHASLDQSSLILA